MKLAVDHVAIRVKDFERCKDFYKKYFGFEQFDSFDNPAPVGRELHLRSGDVHLELFLARDSTKELDEIGKKEPGVCHFCFNVDHIEEVYERLKSGGVPLLGEVAKTTLDSGKWCKYFFFKDPDDTIVEVLEGFYS